MSFDAYTTAGQGQNLFQQLCIQSTRDPVNGVDFNDPGGGPYQIGRRWFNKVNENYWRYQGQGIWILDSSNPGPLIKIGVPAGTSPIQPDTSGLVNFTSTGGTVTITGSAGGVGAQNINFDVSGGSVAEKFTVQAGSPTVITPTAGNVNVDGAVVAATSAPVQSFGNSSNTYTINVQQASVVTPTPANNNAVGLASYNTNQFQIDSTSGMVSLKGGTVNPPLLTLEGNDSVKVSPDSTGNINLLGNTVANATHTLAPVYVVNSASNTERVDVQVSGQFSSSAIGNAGLASFNSSQFVVDSNGFVSTITSPTNMEGAYNIGISYSSGVFTVLSANGTAFSTSNPGFITINSATSPGTLVTIKITANQTFQDNVGTGTINSNVFGLSTYTINNDIPFYLYAVLNTAENAIQFAVSRQAARTLSPVAGSIGASGTNNANNQYSFFLLGSPTIANFATQPSLMIGSFRMQKTSSTAWVVSAIASTDGIGRYQVGVDFTLPKGILGASSGSYWLPSGGTAPTFTNESYFYRINQSNGYVNISYEADTLTNTPSGGTQTAVITPMNGSANMRYGTVTGSYQLTPLNKGMLNGGFNPSTLQFAYFDAGSSGNLSNGNIAAYTIFVFNAAYGPQTS